MASNPDNCAICDRSPSEGVRMGSSGVSGGLSIECPRCGRYELIGTEAMAKSFSWLPKLRGALSCAARQGFEGGQPIRISGGNAEELAQPHMNTRVSDNQERPAMWFSEETRAAYEVGIEPAILRAGFTPSRIDRKEHNNEIPDEIISEIRNSEFMVADFTGQRAGVYYEAGFAMGLGRRVIWCCRDDDIDKLHFDTNHRNHIKWRTPQELGERLYTRISH